MIVDQYLVSDRWLVECEQQLGTSTSAVYHTDCHA